jgi:hypothetical protein
LAGGDQFALTRTTALLGAFVTKEVTVPWRATQEFTGACLLEAFGDGFTCFLHEKVGKDGENTAFEAACKGLKAIKSKWFHIGTKIPAGNRLNNSFLMVVRRLVKKGKGGRATRPPKQQHGVNVGESPTLLLRSMAQTSPTCPR